MMSKRKFRILSGDMGDQGFFRPIPPQRMIPPFLTRVLRVLGELPARALEEANEVIIWPFSRIIRLTTARSDCIICGDIFIFPRVIRLYPASWLDTNLENYQMSSPMNWGILMAFSIYFSPSPDNAWVRAKQLDNNSVSEYGDTKPGERILPRPQWCILERREELLATKG